MRKPILGFALRVAVTLAVVFLVGVTTLVWVETTEAHGCHAVGQCGGLKHCPMPPPGECEEVYCASGPYQCVVYCDGGVYSCWVSSGCSWWSCQ